MDTWPGSGLRSGLGLGLGLGSGLGLRLGLGRGHGRGSGACQESVDLTSPAICWADRVGMILRECTSGELVDASGDAERAEVAGSLLATDTAGAVPG